MVAIHAAVAVLALTATPDPLLLNFTADWCGPCQQVKPSVERLVSAGYPIEVIDVDQRPDLARRFQVQAVPTFVVVRQGREVSRQQGPLDQAGLAGLLHAAGYTPQGSGSTAVRGQSPQAGAATGSGLEQFPRITSQNPAFGPDGLPTHPDTRKYRRAPNAPRWQGPSDPTARLTQVTPYESPQQSPSPQPRAEQVMPAAHQTAAEAPQPAHDWLSPPSEAPVSTPPPDTRPSQPDRHPGPAAMAGDDAQRDPLVRRLMQASVRLKVTDPDGHSYGSGTIIDSRGGEALIITCGHVFRDSGENGEILVHLHGHYDEPPLRGTLISYDLQNDVGLVSIHVDRPVVTARVASEDYSARRHDRVLSIGCDNGRPATARWGDILAVNSIVGRPTYQVTGQPAVGRSGGGLFTSDGQLIGICNYADPTDRAGLFAGLATVQQELDRAGLSFVYSARHQVPEEIAAAERDRNPIFPHDELGTEDRLAEVPDLPATMPRDLRPASVREDRELEPAGDSMTELICIVRTRDATGEEKVLVIRQPSSELLSQLAEEHRSQPGPFFTSGRLRAADGAELEPIRR